MPVPMAEKGDIAKVSGLAEIVRIGGDQRCFVFDGNGVVNRV
jgi:hypothetical protein